MAAGNKSAKKISPIVRRLILIILGLAVGVNAYLANAKGLTGNQLPMPFGVGAAVVLSGSMEPTYHVNDVIFVKESDVYDIGDVVVFQTENVLVVHRIIDQNEEMITTQGDANNISDNPIAREAVKGVVVGHIPGIGGLIRLVKTPVGTLALLICAFLLVEMSFRKEKDADDEQLAAIKEEIRRLKAEQEQASQDKE